MSINNHSEEKKKKRIALYVIYDPDGKLDGYRKYYLQELRSVVDYIVVIISGIITPESREELEIYSDEILVRENKGLLAGSWIDGIKFIGWDCLSRYDELLMLNDSFFGPFYPLKDMFEKMEESNADFYGAFKNYEEKKLHEIAGRKLKHNYFRGSICYFYIIKERLLHSPEFKKYWSQAPNIKENWDTYFFAEMDFYDYVLDSGFRIDAYQSDNLKGYLFDNLTHNMYKLIKDDKIPFARIRPFGTDVKGQSLLVNYGKDPRETLNYIDKFTDYDINLIWDFLLRTKNLSHIWNQLQLEYVVPKNSIEKEFTYTDRIAVIIHIYYENLVENITNYCENFLPNTDFYVTTTDEKVKNTIENAFKNRNLKCKCVVRPNVGVAMSSLWVTFSNIVLSGKYKYICYFHDKKSPYTDYAVTGEQFAKRCYDNLFGTTEIVKNIINIFEDNNRLGIIGPPMVYNGPYFFVSWRSWKLNYKNTVKLAKFLDLHVNIDESVMPVAPYGDMFWFRTDALKKVIGKNLDYDFFNIKYEKDGTILHAMERIYGFAAQDSGYYYADVINTDDARSDLVNYQYMLYGLCNEMLKNGLDPYTYSRACEIVRTCKNNSIGLRHALKQTMKKHLPSPIWFIGKKVYRTFKPIK
ncbi:rhamnan synthesis F family protein [Megasphaera sp.]|uniref:rhamnan synthesis F family protein n=1 Tax=Megasphaera sp. TaxID=2023260 RepID=UPI003FF01B5F